MLQEQHMMELILITKHYQKLIELLLRQIKQIHKKLITNILQIIMAEEKKHIGMEVNGINIMLMER